MNVMNGNMPVSFAQQSLWLLDRVQSNKTLYNTFKAWKVSGKLDLQIFARSVNEIVRRHEILRTSFHEVDGQAIQAITSSLTIHIPLVDLTAQTTETQGRLLQEWIQAESSTPFRLQETPLLRVRLFHLQADLYVFLLTVHHIIFDGWSAGLFLRELGAFYTAFTNNAPPVISDLPIQYADFAAWQREWLQGEVIEQQLTYWKQHLQGSSYYLEMPTDHPRPLMNSFAGALFLHTLPLSLLEQLKALSSRKHATLFMVLFSAFALLVQRYTGQSDLLIGVPVANRPLEELESLIGFFTNTLPLRARLVGNPTFEEALERIRTEIFETYNYQELPFERLVEELQPQRSSSYTPLFQVAFALQNTPRLQRDDCPITLEPLTTERTTAKCDLSLYIEDTAEGLDCEFEYSTDLFTEGTIARLAEQFRVLLESIVAHPQQRIGDLALLPTAEHRLVLEDWNTRAEAAPEPRCLEKLFEAQVQHSPDAIAVVYENIQLTYGALNQHANRLAHTLQAKGVGPDVLVGLCFERSPEMLIALLGVLKAGGAYVPLDPVYPQERLAFIIQDAHVRLIVTQEQLCERLPQNEPEIFCLDTEWSRIRQNNPENPASRNVPENLAYVIYTSGSTGKPKGVLISHRGFSSLSREQSRIFALQTPRRVLQAASFSFDISVFEITKALLTGGTLHLYPRTRQLIGTDLFLTLDEQAIEVATLTPAALVTLPYAELPALKHMLVGGEACPLEQARFWSRARHFFHGYGPTETTILASETLCSPEQERMHIGHPIAQTQLYVLDPRLQPVPVGVPGELCIGGPGLARGYQGNADLTAERFVPHPFSQEPGARLYRTGDLAHILPDGNIEFLGRIDHQVKIHGHRIELGEIETVLGLHSSVQSCVVSVREDGSGNKRLVAYIVAREASTWPTVDEWRLALRKTLPDYMLPTVFMRLDTLPLTSNGKIDRKALPEPEDRLPDEHFVAPRNLVEQQMTQIWQEVLGVEHIGIHDNFFTLGGDSILSLQIVARAHQRGLHLETTALFHYQTIAELGTTASSESSPEQVLTTLETLDTSVPLTPIQEWFFAHETFDRQHWNQAIRLAIPSHWKQQLIRQAIQAIVAQHEAFRLRFTPLLESTGWLARLAPEPGEIPLALVHLQGLPPEQQQQLMDEQTAHVQRSLNLEHGPLVAAVLCLSASEQSNSLLLVAHHLVIDGVSWRILLNDLRLACEQLNRGEPLHLPQERTPWSQWARARTATPLLTQALEQLPFWEWSCGPQVAPLPLDHPGGSNQIIWARTLQQQLTVQETQTLLRRVPEAYHIRVHEVLLAALAQTLADWWDPESVIIHVEGHGREGIPGERDIAQTIGWFTSLYPLRLPVAEHEQPGWMLKQVKERVRSIPDSGSGYGLLRYLHPQSKERLQASEQANVAFNYQSQRDQTPSEDIHLLQEGANAWCNEQSQRTHLLEIHGQVQDGQLSLAWTYSEQLHQQATIERLAQNFMQRLRELITYCCSATEAGYTPADFSLCPLTQPQMDRLMQRLQPGPTDIQDIYPLSTMQQGMVFQNAFGQRAGIYHVQTQMRIEQDLKIEFFLKSWQQVMERHAVLRSSISLGTEEQEAIQLVWKQLPLPYKLYDWQGESAQVQQERLLAYLEAERLRGIDIEQAPLWRLSFFQLGPQQYEAIYSFHHAILDGWSSSLIMAEVATIYTALWQEQTLQLPAEQPYREYIRWLNAQDLDVAEHYWREQLRGFQHATPLDMEQHERSLALLARDEDHVTDELASISEQETTLLTAFARTHQLTLNTIIQGMWGLLLSRYSREDDIVFGVTVSGRPGALQDVEQIIGLFINTLPLRLHIEDQAACVDWLQEIQIKSGELRDYEYSPLVQVQRWSEIEPGKPLFESILVFENYPVNEQDSVKLKTRNIRSLERANYPLNLAVAPGPRLLLRIVYDTQHFQSATIQRLLQQLQTLLHNLVQHPHEKLAYLSLLQPQEWQRTVIDWNATHTSYPATQSLTAQFEQQVERLPDAIAITDGQDQITYHELNRRANQLTGYIQSLGREREEHIGLAMERSLEMVIGILAILKAGGAYVPLDLSYPPERLALMLHDADIHLLITLKQHAEGFLPEDVQLLCLDQAWPDDVQNATSNPSQQIPSTEMLAYVLYTSGSTGRPKGVAIPHRAVTRLVRETNYIRFVETDRVAHLSNTSFDAATFEIWGALLNGARLLVIPRRTLLDPSTLAHLLHEEACSIILVTTALFHQLISLDNAFFSQQRLLIFGGEAVDPGRVREALAGSPPAELLHAYGPTECTSIATWYPVEAVAEHAATVPIGRPISNTQVYILDQHMQVVSVGIVGELYLGGAGLARGYINRADATAEFFRPDPFSLERGARLYKTGDLVRYQADGAIKFIGRVDQQVKIRGFRIEPGEIEVALSQHPAVQACVVLVRTNTSGELSLFAYIATSQQCTVGEIRTFLRQRLPEYMLPPEIIFLDALPLTPNGKIDRRALPAPDTFTQAPEQNLARPLTRTEETLAAIWSRALGKEWIDTSSTLFELGGHSLIAVRIINQMRETFQIDLPLHVLFEAPTISGLAERVDAFQLIQNISAVAPSQVESREEGIL